MGTGKERNKATEQAREMDFVLDVEAGKKITVDDLPPGWAFVRLPNEDVSHIVKLRPFGQYELAAIRRFTLTVRRGGE